MFSWCFHFVRIVPERCIVLASFLTIADSVKIEKLIVPEVIQAGSSSGALLECFYSGVSDQYVIQWLFNGSEAPVYQWSPKSSEPLVSDVLDGKIDMAYEPPVTAGALIERHVLKITSLEPELSGEYTCRVLDQEAEARQTKTMLVFRPEKDFTLEFWRQPEEVNVKCTAKGLYPQPELILERNGVIFQKQQLRMWRSQGLLFDAESTTTLNIPALESLKPEHITCRLQIPLAGYSAMKKELLYIGKECSNNNSPDVPASDSVLYVFLSVMAIKFY